MNALERQTRSLLVLEHYEVWKLTDKSSEYELLHFRAGREVPDTVTIGTRAHCINEAPMRPTRVDA